VREDKRVHDEDRPQEGSSLDEDVAGVSAKHSLSHASAYDAAKATLFRLLKHDDSSEQEARQHFDNIKQTYKETHFLLTFL